MPDDIVVQSETRANAYESYAFSGVPAARASWIVLQSSGSDRGRGYVQKLRTEIEAVLMGSIPGVRRSVVAGAPFPASAPDASHQGRLRVLVLVGSEDAAFRDTAWFNAWESEPDACVMTVLPPARFEDLFDAQIRGDATHLLRRVNGAVWQVQITEVLPAVLARSEVTSAVPRVFISYRRVETLPVALQLFDRLTHEGFEAFLDRFSIPPGFDFQRRLSQELEDKSMILLLDSPSVPKSRWTQHEINYAKRNRLGLMVVRMPNVDATAAVDATDALVRLALNDFTSAPSALPDPDDASATLTQWPRLTDAALDRVIAEIKSSHADVLFRRRHRLRTDVAYALRAAGVDCDCPAVGPLVARTTAGEHLVWVTTRPPQVEDFQSLYSAHAARPNAPYPPRGVIVGPQAALEPDRQARLRWLHKVTDCRSFDEGNLAEIAQRFVHGSWQ